MIEYVFDDEDCLRICAFDQRWDDETLKQLKDEHNITFMTKGDGVSPVMVIDRGDGYPLVVIGGEDDGTIFFKKQYGQFECCFSLYWLPHLIADLEKVLKENPYANR